MRIREKKFLYLMRVRMTNVGYNFGNKRECQACELPGTEDNQEHAFIDCIKTGSSNKTVNYSDLFSQDTDKMINTAKVMHEAYMKRTEYLEKQKR